MSVRVRGCDKTFLVPSFCLTFRHFFFCILFLKLISLCESKHEFVADDKRTTQAGGTVKIKTVNLIMETHRDRYTRHTVRKNLAYFYCRNYKKSCCAGAFCGLEGDRNEVENYALVFCVLYSLVSCQSGH